MGGFVKGFGLKSGAIATSINHDSHNVIAVGSSDEDIIRAVNHLIEVDGGIVVAGADREINHLQLPIGGLMTPDSPESIQKTLNQLKKSAGEAGCSLHEPFLQLSFLALPVIPTPKITDRGLVAAKGSRSGRRRSKEP